MATTLSTRIKETISSLSSRRANGQERNGDSELDVTAVFVDKSASTYNFFHRHTLFGKVDESQRDDPRFRDGSEFIIQRAIGDGVARIADSIGTTEDGDGDMQSSEATGAENDLLSFLSSMKKSEHPRVMVTIGNPNEPSLVEETSNLRSTNQVFSETACPTGTTDLHKITRGTSIRGAFRAFLSSKFVERAKKSGKSKAPQTFHILTDGQCDSDSIANIERAIRDVLEVFPRAMLKIHAYVLNKKPLRSNVTEQSMSTVPGLDIFNQINSTFDKNIDAYIVNYLLQENSAGRYVIADPPDQLVLASGKEAGATVIFTCFDGAKVSIPDDNVKRNEIVVGLVNAMLAHPDDFSKVKDADINDILENLLAIGKYMDETTLQNSLAALVVGWFLAKNPHAEQTPKKLKEHKKNTRAFLQEKVFIPRQDALLNGHTGLKLRTQETRKANFAIIREFWERHPVIYDGFIGHTIVLFDKGDVKKMACVPLTRSLMDQYDNNTFLFYGKFVGVPSSIIGTKDYFRMMIRRMFGRVAWTEGVRLPKVPNADKMSMLPHMVGCVALLSTMARNALGEGPLVEELTSATGVMLQKEQVDQSVKPPRTLPSAYYMLKHDEGLPDEYKSLPMLKRDPARLLSYASDLGNQSPVPSSFATNDVLQIPKVIDMFTHQSLNGLTYYCYKNRDQYVSKETYERIITTHSYMGNVYTERDFVEVQVEDDARLLRWISAPSSSSETAVSFASLFAS